jgi:phosphate transport system permease protein
MDFSSRGQKLNFTLRKVKNNLVAGLAMLATALVLVPLAAILIYLVYKGASSLNVNFFTKMPAAPGEVGGGMANSIVGSGIILGFASLMGIPVGVAAGVYLAEFGRGKMLGNAVRFTADVLNGVPSIVVGIAMYALIVKPTLHFSAFAGGVALAVMMIPTITRTTEEMLSTVPHAIREAALGLGVPKWRTTISVALRTASPGIITGCMLAFARVAGETAPLLFTALGNEFMINKPNELFNQPIDALPLRIYKYANSPFDEWHRVAWAGSLVLIMMIMVSVTLVRIFANRGVLKGGN